MAVRVPHLWVQEHKEGKEHKSIKMQEQHFNVPTTYELS